MKKALYGGFAVLILGLVVLVVSSCSSSTPSPTVSSADLATLKAIGGPPPASLDQYYPPVSKQGPVFFIDMLNMAGPFGGIGASLAKNDAAGMKTNFTAFQTQYTAMSKMVPEWTTRFKVDTVTALGTAINGGDPAKIGPAMAAAGQVCTDCHLLDQIKVEQKYSWPNFDTIKVTDPVSGKSLAWVDYMTAMAGNYEGAMGALAANQPAAAAGAFKAFQSQYTAMATDGCKQCHTDPVTKQEIPRKYFVDADSMALISKMATALSATPPDAATAGATAQVIANDLCMKCHLVHFPAQNAKDLWSTYANILK
jgi:hypothetical protein